MSTPIFPPSVKSAGTIKVGYTPTLANPKAPKLTELTGTGAFDATQYFRREAFNLTIEQGTTDDTRLGDETARLALGLPTFNFDGGLSYVHQPQAVSGAPGNLAYDAFTPESTGFFVIRYGNATMKSSLAWAIGQLVAVYSVVFGEQHQPTTVGDDAAIHVISQTVTAKREIARVALVA